MDPSSPPDIVPVENNSQPLSQGMNSSGRFPSLTSPGWNFHILYKYFIYLFIYGQN